MNRFFKTLVEKTSKSERKRQPARARLRLDSLEPRAVPAGQLTATLSLVDSVLRIEGTPAADQIHVRHENGTIRVDGINITLTGDDSPTVAPSVARTRVVRIEVNALDGNDLVQMHNTLLAGESPVPMIVDGGAGNDAVTSGLANDTIIGGLGDDVLSGTGGADVINGAGDEDIAIQPVAQYKAEADAVDATGGNDGETFGTVEFAPGRVGQAFQFSGYEVPGYVQALNAPELEPNTVSVEAWINSADVPEHATYRYILSKGAAEFRGASYALVSSINSGLWFYVGNGSAFQYSPDPGSGIWDGNWHHVVGTYDGSFVRLYVDGLEVGNGTQLDNALGYGLPTNNDLFIGTYNGIDGYTFNGLIDEPAVYDRALTAAEVRARFLQPVSSYQAEGDARDATGANHGTIQGNVTFVPGQVGQAFDFDGVGAQVELGSDSSLDLPGSMSVSTWVRLETLSHFKYLFADFASNGFTSQGSLGALDVGSNFYWFQAYTDGTHDWVNGTTPIELNQWYHLAAVRDDATKTVRLFVNGVEEASLSYAGKSIVPLQGSKFLGSAGPQFPADFMDGQLDEVSVFDRALGAAEVQALFAGQSTGTDTGRDTLVGGNGSDTLSGGDGDDLLIGQNDKDVLYGEGGNDYMIGAFNGSPTELGNAGDSLFGGVGNDVLYGGDGVDWLWGEAGNDEIHGQDGGDALDGGDGNDYLVGEADNDNVVGGDGDDILEGNSGDDTLWGGFWLNAALGTQDNDELSGGGGSDQLYGGAGNDTLRGDPTGILGVLFGGNDTAVGGDGNDALYGGVGNDRLVGENGSDYLNGGADNDELIGCFHGSPFEFGSANDTIEGGTGHDSLFGGDGNDFLVGQSGNDFLTGENGNDVLDGGWSGTTAETGGRNDTIYGGNGDDFLWGGEGADFLTGDHGNDTIMGETGADDLDGGLRGPSPEIGPDRDVLDGGPQNDFIWGGEGNDFMNGAGGNDTLRGELGFDTLLGGNGNDLLAGESGDDYHDGGDGDDHIVGDDGRDTMHGGDGNDKLFADRGDETLSGGERVSLGIAGGDSAAGTNFCGPSAASRFLRSYQFADATYPELIARTQEFQFNNPIDDIYSLISALELGTVPDHMINVMRQWRPETQKAHQSNLGFVLELLGQGRPVIALVNSAGTVVNGRVNDAGYIRVGGVVPKTLHYVTLSGYDANTQTIFYMDADGTSKQYSYTDFLARWDFRTRGPTGAFLTGPLGSKERTIIW